MAGQRARRGRIFQLLGKLWEDIPNKQDVVSLIQPWTSILLHGRLLNLKMRVVSYELLIHYPLFVPGSSDPENVSIISNAGHVVMSKLGSGVISVTSMARSGRQASPLHGTRQIEGNSGDRSDYTPDGVATDSIKTSMRFTSDGVRPDE